MVPRDSNDAKTLTDQQIQFEHGLVPVETSGWTMPEGLATRYPALEGDVDVDVAIVGAGLAGSSLALHLAEAGIRVAVVEARQPGWGASGRNAGHVLPILKDMQLLAAFPDGGRKFINIFREHHTIPFDLSQKHGIDCDATRSGYLNGMTRRATFQDFLARSAYLQDMGFQKVTPLTGADMKTATGSDYYPFGVVYENGGRVNPYRFTNGMIAAAVRMGAAVYGDSEALTLGKDGGRWRLSTTGGIVRAGRVIFCTNAYPTDVVPQFTKGFYPLTAYALTTRPLPAEALDHIMPGGATFAQVPVDLNPLVRDRHNRLILSSIPKIGGSSDAAWHFQNQLRWIHRTWPATRHMRIELEAYWTGRVAMRDKEFPGVFELQPGLYGLMYCNAWGNVMAPLMGKILAEGLQRDRMDALPFPIEQLEPVSFQRKHEVLIRHLLIPAARIAQRLNIL
ncbi:NAD(P)/FAD-dependent oxidoreductase [Sphingomonas sp. KC8]|uniref:NAD(P)/FAD-dependent oxidoreductase n=1 Tax=Sphingomonas sp. KC8 TaxID=1030157 RepID=UPI00024893BD|nr:FAD-binding oxidoreductase [Sphingomonas sp. KC8]ARS27797.1 FAD-dependent oxidoreductase [Sphingomonas sp. KC8]